MLLFTECSTVTVECCILYPCCVGVFGMFERLCKEEGSYPVSAITEWRDMGMYEVPLSMSLLDFGIWTMLANFHICGIMLVLRICLGVVDDDKSRSCSGP